MYAYICINIADIPMEEETVIHQLCFYNEIIGLYDWSKTMVGNDNVLSFGHTEAAT